MTDIKKSILLRLPEDLVKKADARAKERGMSRNQWFENMTKWVVENKR
jgi:predicted HicB family RNase H-like nuclease